MNTHNHQNVACPNARLPQLKRICRPRLVLLPILVSLMFAGHVGSVLAQAGQTSPTPAERQRTIVIGKITGDPKKHFGRLEKMAAERMGKEAAMLVASGTMGNLVCVLTHCRRGDEAILGNQSHTFIYEGGGIAALGGIHPHTVVNQPDGTLRLEDIEAAVRQLMKGNN